MTLSRSEVMGRIRGSDTEPEVQLRRALWKAGLRYRLQVKTPAGRADLASVTRRIAVFVDGCFWHGCPAHYVRPRSRPEFWAEKLRGNVDRDRRQTLAAEAVGWRVLRLWECEVRCNLEEAVRRVSDAWAGKRKVDTGPAWRVVRVESVSGVAEAEARYLEDLRQPDRRKVVHGRRSTDKGWR